MTVRVTKEGHRCPRCGEILPQQKEAQSKDKRIEPPKGKVSKEE
jgi:uncharacterized C2H2 Zn-finger protein